MHAPRIPGIPTTQVSPGILTSKLKAFFVLASFLEIFLRGEHNYTGGKFLNVFFNLLVVAILLFFQAFIQTSGSMSNAKFSKPLWHLVDANGQVVGRLASQIVRILRGKHKPSYTPNYDCGDFVVVVNAGSIKFTGQKTNDKLYKWHTGYPGGLKQISVRDQLDRKPEEVILSQVLRKAVVGMLAKNNMRRMLSKKLRIFPGDNHLFMDKLPAGTPSIFK